MHARTKRLSARGKRKGDSRHSAQSPGDTAAPRSSPRTHPRQDDRAPPGDRGPATPTLPADSGRSSRADATPRQSAPGRPANGGATGAPRTGTRPPGKTKRASTPTPRPPRENVEIDAPARAHMDLARLQNPDVRREAAKLADRVAKFQAGLELAQAGGIKILAGMNVQAELQKIFELADANGDAQLLRQLSNATSFSGKLAPFQPTTEAGRAQVRLAQLFNAVQGDGSYASVRSNIARLASDPQVLRRMARDDALLRGLDNAQYVDSSRLLRTVGGVPARPISENTREWHLEQASLMKAYRDLAGVDAAMQKKLALALLQSFAKAAPLGAAQAEELGAQVSPLLNVPGFYHRSAATNPLLETVLNAYCQDIGIPMGSAHIVDNATFREVLAREYAMEGVTTRIGSLADYNRALQEIFSKAEQGQFPKNKLVLDITDLFRQANLAPNQITTMAASLERTFLDQAEAFLKTHPGVNQANFGEMMQNLQIGAMTRHKGVDVLLTPRFLLRDPVEGDSPLQRTLLRLANPNTTLAHVDFFNAIEHSMIHTGYRLDPIQARRAWLEVADPSVILGKYGIQITELATSDRPTPTVLASVGDLISHSSFRQFEALAATDGAPPYLKTLPKATAAMLRGLAAVGSASGGLDKAMKNYGLDEVLQTSYYRMLNAMAAAVHDQADMVAFMNQVEVIQQQIATIVSLVEPHGADAFGDGIRAALTSPAGPGGRPVIPPGLDKPGVQLKPSALHCLASILSSVEAQKKSNALNVCVVKDHYYESAGAVTAAGTYSVSQFDGDSVRRPGGDGTRPLAPASIKGRTPLDVYVCDFHHNISLGRNHYQLENLQHHVDELYRKNLVAKQFTVAIDCTIDHLNSRDVQAFLEHNKSRIESGELNVVLFRSAQKFDMFGMDNYYGGFSVSINNHRRYADFNTRMALPEDQLKGPSRQGLSHIASSAAQDTDAYRGALMASTRRFYNALPSGMIWSATSTSAMQVARTDDPNAVFLDIKFPGNAKASEAFMERFRRFASEEGLPLTGRASFGFATTNLNLIHGEQTRLTPGLEGPEVQDRYIAFFDAVHRCATTAVRTGTERGLRGEALNEFVAGEIRDMPI
ncbi:MAG TPA: hypothetical protein VNL77_05280 [Roseiflexaceae bacterium]|nr:hypothetical protein [Roseiflexaceae bacterium]